MATITIMGTVFGIASSLAAFGQISINLAIGAGVLLFVAVCCALVYVELNWEPEPITETIDEPTTAAPVPLLTVQATTYTVDHHVSLPMAHLAQPYYLEAFQALVQGGYQQTVNGQRRNWPLGIAVGKVAINWINDHYREYTHRYPGARGDRAKQQLGELAFQHIQEGRLFSAEIAKVIVPLVNRHVSDRFAEEH